MEQYQWKERAARLVTLPLLRNHQPRRVCLRGIKEAAASGLVKMSASWFFVSIHWMVRCPKSTWDRKWWYLRPKWRVRGRIRGAEANSTQPLLSSKIVEWAMVEPTINLVAVDNSWRRCCIGIRSRADWDKAIYSASVVLKATSVWSLEHQRTGQAAKVIIEIKSQWDKFIDF